jgi:hypothetical protein
MDASLKVVCFSETTLAMPKVDAVHSINRVVLTVG